MPMLHDGDNIIMRLNHVPFVAPFSSCAGAGGILDWGFQVGVGVRWVRLASWGGWARWVRLALLGGIDA